MTREENFRVMIKNFIIHLDEMEWNTPDVMAYIAKAVPLLQVEWRSINHERVLMESLPRDVLEQMATGNKS